ncbi:MAG: nitroreductase family protein [Trueperaceae bacterium]
MILLEDTTLHKVETSEKLLELIRFRRSINQAFLKPDAVDEKMIEEMLEAATWAPSHGRTEPWRFTVFTGEARRALGETFATSYKLGAPTDKYKEENETAQRERVWLAPVWIAIGLEPSSKFPEWEEVAAVSCAVQNMNLVAASHGLGCYWTTGMVTLHENTVKFVGLTPPAKTLGFLYIGYPKDAYPTSTRKDWREKMTWHK